MLYGTVLVIISSYFAIFKNVVHSLETGETPISGRLTRLQTMCDVLKYRKIFKNGSVRLHCGCGYFFNLLKTSTVAEVL